MLLNKGLRTIVAKVCHATFYTKHSVFTHPVRMEFKTADRTNPLTHKTVVISYGTQVPSVQVVYLDHLTCRTTGKNNNISFTHYKTMGQCFHGVFSQERNKNSFCSRRQIETGKPVCHRLPSLRQLPTLSPSSSLTRPHPPPPPKKSSFPY